MYHSFGFCRFSILKVRSAWNDSSALIIRKNKITEFIPMNIHVFGVTQLL